MTLRKKVADAKLSSKELRQWRKKLYAELSASTAKAHGHKSPVKDWFQDELEELRIKCSRGDVFAVDDLEDFFDRNPGVDRPEWARHARALERIEDEYDKGNPLAVPYAVLYCSKYDGLTLPRWACVAQSLKLRGKTKQSRRKGRHHDPLEEYRDALIDSIRYDAVNDYVDHLKQDPDNVIKMDRYKAGSILVAGGIAGGEPRAIRDSFSKHRDRNPNDVVRSTPWEWSKLLAPDLSPGCRQLATPERPERSWGFNYAPGAVASLLKKRH